MHSHVAVLAGEIEALVLEVSGREGRPTVDEPPQDFDEREHVGARVHILDPGVLVFRCPETPSTGRSILGG